MKQHTAALHSRRANCIATNSSVAMMTIALVLILVSISAAQPTMTTPSPPPQPSGLKVNIAPNNVNGNFSTLVSIACSDADNCPPFTGVKFFVSVVTAPQIPITLIGQAVQVQPGPIPVSCSSPFPLLDDSGKYLECTCRVDIDTVLVSAVMPHYYRGDVTLGVNATGTDTTTSVIVSSARETVIVSKDGAFNSSSVDGGDGSGTPPPVGNGGGGGGGVSNPTTEAPANSDDPDGPERGRVSLGVLVFPDPCSVQVHILLWVLLLYLLFFIPRAVLFIVCKKCLAPSSNELLSRLGHRLIGISGWIDRADAEGNLIPVSNRLRAREALIPQHIWVGIIFPCHLDTSFLQLAIALVHILAIVAFGSILLNEFGTLFPSSPTTRAALLGLFASMIATMVQPLSHIPYTKCNLVDKRMEVVNEEVERRRSAQHQDEMMAEWQQTTDAQNPPPQENPVGARPPPLQVAQESPALLSPVLRTTPSADPPAVDTTGGRVEPPDAFANSAAAPGGQVPATRGGGGGGGGPENISPKEGDGSSSRDAIHQLPLPSRAPGLFSPVMQSGSSESPSSLRGGTPTTESRRVTFEESTGTNGGPSNLNSSAMVTIGGASAGATPMTTTAATNSGDGIGIRSPTAETPGAGATTAAATGDLVTTTAPPQPLQQDPLATHVLVDTRNHRFMGHILNALFAIGLAVWIVSSTSHWCAKEHGELNELFLAAFLYDVVVMQPIFCGLIGLSQYMNLDVDDGVKHTPEAGESRGVTTTFVPDETTGIMRSVFTPAKDGHYACYPIEGEPRFVGRLRFTSELLSSHWAARAAALHNEGAGGYDAFDGVDMGSHSRSVASSTTTAGSRRQPLHRQQAPARASRSRAVAAQRAAVAAAAVDPEFWQDNSSLGGGNAAGAYDARPRLAGT